MMRTNANYVSGMDASYSNTFSAAGSVSGTASLGNGQVGKPVRIKVSGSVSGQAVITYGNNASKIVPCNPNAPFTEDVIPATAFPKPTNAVSITLTADGAGVIRAIVTFV